VTLSKEAAKHRDRELARERMRRRRENGFGYTTYDRARVHATRALIAAHREEFDQLQREFIYREEAE
jgi:hypothetical protein